MMPKHINKRSLVANAKTQLALSTALDFWSKGEAETCPALLEHCATYSTARDVVDLIIEIKHRRQDTLSARQELIVKYGRWLTLHKIRYGTTYIKPKFNWLWCIVLGLASSSYLFDMFSVERLHRRIKRQAELVRNTTIFECSVLQRVLDDQVAMLQNFDIVSRRYGLHPRSVLCSCDGIHAAMADSLVWQGVEFHVDDIVVFGLQRGIVIACFQLLTHGQLLLRVEMMIRTRGGRYRYEHTSAQQLWPPANVH